MGKSPAYNAAKQQFTFDHLLALIHEKPEIRELMHNLKSQLVFTPGNKKSAEFAKKLFADPSLVSLVDETFKQYDLPQDERQEMIRDFMVNGSTALHVQSTMEMAEQGAHAVFREGQPGADDPNKLPPYFDVEDILAIWNGKEEDYAYYLSTIAHEAKTPQEIFRQRKGYFCAKMMSIRHGYRLEKKPELDKALEYVDFGRFSEWFSNSQKSAEKLSAQIETALSMKMEEPEKTEPEKTEPAPTNEWEAFKKKTLEDAAELKQVLEDEYRYVEEHYDPTNPKTVKPLTDQEKVIIDLDEVKQRLEDPAYRAMFENTRAISDLEAKQDVLKESIDFHNQASGNGFVRGIHFLTKTDDTEEAREYNERLKEAFNNPRYKDAVIYEQTNAILHLNLAEIDQTIDDPKQIMTYFKENYSSLRSAFLMKDLTSSITNKNPTFSAFVDNSIRFVECLNGYREKSLFMKTEAPFLFSGKLSLEQAMTLSNIFGGEDGYHHIGATRGNIREGFTNPFKPMVKEIFPYIASSTKSELEAIKSKGAVMDRMTLLRYKAVKVSETGEEKEVKLSEIASERNVKDPAYKLVERTPEEMRAIQSMSASSKDSAKTQARIFEMKHFLRSGDPRSMSKIRSANSMFFSFKQSGQYSEFEKTSGKFFDRLSKEGFSDKTVELMKQTAEKAKKYLEYKGEPDQKKDPRGFNRVQFAKSLIETIEKEDWQRYMDPETQLRLEAERAAEQNQPAVTQPTEQKDNRTPVVVEEAAELQKDKNDLTVEANGPVANADLNKDAAEVGERANEI